MLSNPLKRLNRRIRFRKGLEKDLPEYTHVGEPLVTIDEDLDSELYVGMGAKVPVRKLTNNKDFKALKSLVDSLLNKGFDKLLMKDIGRENGIIFPTDPFGGSGDNARIYVRKGPTPPDHVDCVVQEDGLNYVGPVHTTPHLHEHYELVIEVLNDSGVSTQNGPDCLRIITNADVFINEHKVAHEGNIDSLVNLSGNSTITGMQNTINSLQQTLTTLQQSYNNLNTDYTNFKNSKGKANGISPLDGSSKVPKANSYGSTVSTRAVASGNSINVGTSSGYIVSEVNFSNSVVDIDYAKNSHSCGMQVLINNVLIGTDTTTTHCKLKIVDGRCTGSVGTTQVNVNVGTATSNTIKFVYNSGCADPILRHLHIHESKVV